MKRISIIFLTAAILFGCSKLEEINHPVQDETATEIETSAALPEVIYASVNDEQNDTRTYVDGKKVFWQTGDAISYFSGKIHNVKYNYNGDRPATSVEFNKVDQTGTTKNLIVEPIGIYPYHEDNGVGYQNDAYIFSVVYPSSQNYVENSFGRGANLMIATSDNDDANNLYFRNACGYLILKLYGEGVSIKTITLSALNSSVKIAGPALIVTDEDDIPVVTMTDSATNTVQMDCSNGGEGVALSAVQANPTEFWFALPPVAIEGGIAISVIDINDNEFIKSTTKTINIERNCIQPMAALEFIANTSKIEYTLAGGGSTPITFSEDAATNPFGVGIRDHYFDEKAGKFVIEFDNNLKTIREGAFKDTGIQTIELPPSLETIEDDVFYNTPLTSITIPGSVNRIGVDAFYNCTSLSSVTFLPSPENTTLRIGYSTSGGVGKSTFEQSPLSSIYFDREMIFVDGNDELFVPYLSNPVGVFSVKGVAPVSVTIGEQVRTISDCMFCGLKMQSITIPDNVTLIGRAAFKDCTNLSTLIFEESETPLEVRSQDDQIDLGPFYDCPLTYIYYNRNFNYTIRDGEEFIPSKDEEGLFAIYLTTSVSIQDNESTVYIGPLIEDIPDYAFCNLPIRKLTIPKTVNTIGNGVFNGCSRLNAVTFEEHTEPITLGYEDGLLIDEGLFCDARLTSVTLNRQIIYPFTGGTLDGPTKGVFACSFYGNAYLTDITIGDQVKTLPPYTFAGAGALTVDLNKVTSIGKGAFENAKLAEITIPANVVEISDDAFKNCKSLASITFEASATPLTIGFQPGAGEVGPFYQSPLTSVCLNRELVASESYAAARNEDDEGFFSYITSLANVTIGEQVKSIPPFTFSTTGITSVTIPGNVESIGHNAFAYCESLHTIDIAEGDDPITISTQKGEWAPFYESPLSTIKINRNVIYKNEYGNSFTPDTSNEGLFCNECTGDVAQVSVNIGAKLNAISDFMFSELNIVQIWIPREVTSIGKSAFADCAKFVGLTCNHTDPPTLGEDAFEDCGSIRYINVIKGAKAAFEEAPGWSAYKSIITEWTPAPEN